LLFLIGVAVAFYSIPLVKIRVDDTAAVFLKRDVTTEDINRTNLSTYSLYSNYAVARMSLSENPILGSGLGTHELNYDSYIRLAVPRNNFRELYQLNKKDATGLLLRIASELGFAGLLLGGLFIFRNRISFNATRGVAYMHRWLFSNGILVTIVVRLLRQGHYTMMGFVLLIMIYAFLKEDMFFESNEPATSNSSVL